MPIVADCTHWDDWGRYSTRQEQRVKLGGFLGQVTYAGNLDEFMPLLLARGMVHMGKGTVFGNGQYTMLLSGRDRVTKPQAGHVDAPPACLCHILFEHEHV